jgi:hypothetical protein
MEEGLPRLSIERQDIEKSKQPLKRISRGEKGYAKRRSHHSLLSHPATVTLRHKLPCG